MTATRAELEARLADVREEIAYNRDMEDRAAEGLDGMDHGDRCYYGDRAYDYGEERDALEAQLAALDT